MSAFDNATLMITGGTGSFGSTVLKHFLDSDLKEIRIFSRDEKKQDDMRHELQAKHPENAKKVKFYIGDVRNPQSMSALTKIKQDTFLSKFILISNPSRRWNRSLPDLSRRDGSLKKHHIDFLYAAARHRAEFYT